jgi:peptidoglycan/xylan/chitin deacetylase (PgdA/CDA1 family)
VRRTPRNTLATRDVLVLCYHGVSDGWPSPGAVSLDSLEHQLDYLLRRGYRPARFTEAVLDPSAPQTVALTFDDAYLSVFERAFPVLESLGVPATVFVPTSWLAGRPMGWQGVDRWLGTQHERELSPMSWSDVEVLVEAGWEVGSHTCSHLHLTAVDDATLAAELEESKAECEKRLGRPCTSVAYPYGDVDGRVVRAAGRAGSRAGAGLPGRVGAQRPLEWPRVGVYASDGPDRFRVKTSPIRRRFVGVRAGEWLLTSDRLLRERLGRPRY